jgi:hypothetical protein
LFTGDSLGSLNSVGRVVEGLKVVLSQLAFVVVVDADELHVHFPRPEKLRNNKTYLCYNFHVIFEKNASKEDSKSRLSNWPINEIDLLWGSLKF